MQPPSSQLSLRSLPKSPNQYSCFHFSKGAENKVSILNDRSVLKCSNVFQCSQISRALPGALSPRSHGLTQCSRLLKLWLQGQLGKSHLATLNMWCSLPYNYNTGVWKPTDINRSVPSNYCI